jgi:hypothetical protein
MGRKQKNKKSQSSNNKDEEIVDEQNEETGVSESIDPFATNKSESESNETKTDIPKPTEEIKSEDLEPYKVTESIDPFASKKEETESHVESSDNPSTTDHIKPHELSDSQKSHEKEESKLESLPEEVKKEEPCPTTAVSSVEPSTLAHSEKESVVGLEVTTKAEVEEKPVEAVHSETDPHKDAEIVKHEEKEEKSSHVEEEIKEIKLHEEVKEVPHETKETYHEEPRVETIAASEHLESTSVDHSEKRIIEFNIHYSTNFEEKIVLVGSTNALGSWEVNRGINLEWTEGNIWKGKVELQVEHSEYKYVCVSSDSCRWEEGENHSINFENPLQNNIWQ